MTDTTSIPLNKLTAWDGNVRKTAGADYRPRRTCGIHTFRTDLCASIPGPALGSLTGLLAAALRTARRSGSDEW